jgi:hypothetical protein
LAGDAYVEAIYTYAKAHNIAAVRFQFEISDTYVFDRPQAARCSLKGSFAITSM